VLAAVKSVRHYATKAAHSEKEFQQTGARAFSYAVARIECAALLIEHAAATGDKAAAVAARRWCGRELTSLVEGDADHRAGSEILAESDHQM
jgi:hypothetical protein